MSKLELDLGKIGSTRYLNENEKSVEMFTSKEFQEWKNTDTINVFRDKVATVVKQSKNLSELPFFTCLIGSIVILVTMFVSVFQITNYGMSKDIGLTLIVATFLLTMVAMCLCYAIINYKLKATVNSLNDLSKGDKVSEQLLLQIKNDSGVYSLKTVNKFIMFLEKLDAYPDVTVYRLKDNLTFSTQNFDVYFTDILFLENETGNYFTYAYSNEYLGDEKEPTMTKLTVFDVNIETFEFKPRL